MRGLLVTIHPEETILRWNNRVDKFGEPLGSAVVEKSVVVQVELWGEDIFRQASIILSHDDYSVIVNDIGIPDEELLRMVKQAKTLCELKELIAKRLGGAE